MTSNNPSRKLLGGNMYNQINQDLLKYQEIFYGGQRNMKESKLSTGIESLNEVLHGGYKKGELTEISGAASTGKTLLSLLAIKELQTTEEKLSILIDTSKQFNPINLEENNIDEDGVFLIQPTYAEELGYILTEAIKPIINDIGLIIIDDLATLTTKFEVTSDIRTNTDIHRSKVIKALLTRISNLVRNTNTSVLILNQNRINFLQDGTTEEVSSFEKWVNISCDTRLKLSIDEDGDICTEVRFKERKFK